MEPQQHHQQSAATQQSQQQYEPGKLFVGGISWETTEETMKTYFEKFGEVDESVVMRDPSQDRSLKRNKGFGFIRFKDPLAVHQVLAKLGGHILDGKSIDPKPAVVKGPSGTAMGLEHSKKIFLGGLASHTTPADVKTYFETKYGVGSVVGDVDFKRIKTDNPEEPARMRGFGFVAFATDELRDRAVAEHYHEICGKRAEAKKAQPKMQTQGGPYGGNAVQGYHHYPGGNNGQFGGAGGVGQYYSSNQQYYSHYPQQQGYPNHQQYGAGGGGGGVGGGGYGGYDQSAYSRTQPTSGDHRTHDPNSYYQHQQQSYGHAGGQPVGYGQETSGYGTRYQTNQDSSFNQQQMTGYGGQAVGQQHHHHQQQGPHYSAGGAGGGGGGGAPGGFGH